MKKTLTIIGGCVVAVVVIIIVVLGVALIGSKKMVCKSDEGNITIKYNKKTIVGYASKGISYDLDGQKKYAKKIGVDKYLDEFSDWFSNNTSGTCAK